MTRGKDENSNTVTCMGLAKGSEMCEHQGEGGEGGCGQGPVSECEVLGRPGDAAGSKTWGGTAIALEKPAAPSAIHFFSLSRDVPSLPGSSKGQMP